jgi:hypothetical protein
MYKYGLFLLGTACIIIGLGLAADIPYVFDQSTSSIADYTPAQLESMRAASPDLAGVPSVSTPPDSEVLDFPVTGGGSAPGSTTEKKVGDLKKVFDSRVEPDNSRVHEEATVLALKYPGDLTIDQIDSIYNYLKNGDGTKKGWGYVRDPRGIDYFNYANASLRLGDKANCVGGGDCDDFAILMSALVESIGGTTRIILAHNNTTGGHAYTEVYIGQLDSPNSQVNEIMDWLRQKYNSDKIFTHVVTDTKDVWLNLDWGLDEKGNAHPGGPFYKGDKHIVICIRDTYQKTPLKMPESHQISGTRNPNVAPIQATMHSNNSSMSLKNANNPYYVKSLMHGIWSITGIEQEQITMALEQNGNDLFGTAKYEPDNSNPWNSAVAGSFSGGQVHLVITPQNTSGATSITLDGIYSNDVISGKFIQSSNEGISNRGDFSATLVNPETIEYTPAIIIQPTVYSNDKNMLSLKDQINAVKARLAKMKTDDANGN